MVNWIMVKYLGAIQLTSIHQLVFKYFVRIGFSHIFKRPKRTSTHSLARAYERAVHKLMIRDH